MEKKILRGITFKCKFNFNVNLKAMPNYVKFQWKLNFMFVKI